MRIAICVCSADDAGRLENIVMRCAAGFSVSADCKCYSSPACLYSEFLQGYRHLMYILELEMPQMSGMTLARTIWLSDRNAAVIFVTAHTEWMQEAFDVCAFHFIAAPVADGPAYRVLYRAFEYVLRGRQAFMFRRGRCNYAANTGHIIYFQSFGRKVVVRMETEEIEYYGKLKNVLATVGSAAFVQINRSNVINMARIEYTDFKKVRMCCGQVLPVTDRYRMHFHKIYMNYVALHPQNLQ